ncbi:MAG: GGDEF domain-containing protein [Bacillota bacterium]
MSKDLLFKNKILNMHLEINQFLINNKDYKNIYKLILKKSIDIFPNASKGSFLLFDKKSSSFHFQTVVGYDYKKLKDVKLHISETFIYKNSNLNFKEAIKIKPNYNKEEISKKQMLLNSVIDKDITEVLSIPISHKDEIYGIINLDSKTKFTEKEIEITDYYINIIKTIIQSKNILKKMIKLSKYDKLTNIYNRSFFSEVFEKYSSYAISHSKSFSFVLIDLNYLKLLNDNFGHTVGDKALIELSNHIKKNISKKDIFARIGGDEFVLILDSTKKNKAKEKMEKILDYFKNNFFSYDGNKFYITFSYGISVSPDESMVFDILLKIADKRMYEFKKEFKQKYKKFKPTK